MDLEARKDQERKDRQKELKAKLAETNFGGRGAPVQIYNKQRTAADSQAAKQAQLAEQKAFQERTARQKAIIEQKKKEQVDKMREEQEQHQKAAEEEQKRRESERKVFLAKQKTKISKEFEETYKRRDDLILREEEKKKLEKDNEDRLKRQMTKYIKATAEDRELEKAERTAVDKFLDDPIVSKVFDDYGKQLKAMFQFYASQDSQKDKIAYEAEYLSKTLSFKELVRFGYQQ